MSISELPPKQRRVYDYILDRLERSEVSPTIEEIRLNLNLRSVATVHEHLQTLERRGFIERTPHSPRSITIIRQREIHFGREIPLLGVVSAGQPIEAVLTEEHVWVPLAMCGRANTFALRVRGDSMVEDHIQNGDIIVLEQRQTAESGETVVALIDNSEATVKKFYRDHDNGQIHLRPANAAYDPLILAADRVRVQGVVKGVLHFA